MAVDVAANIMGKACQSALSLLSLLRLHADVVGDIYLSVEAWQPPYDKRSPRLLPALLQQYIGPRLKVFYPRYALGINTLDARRLKNPHYRHSLRYQYAWENSNSEYLLIIHNDVLFESPILPQLLETVQGKAAAGRLGQCWNCPASHAGLAQACGLAHTCTPENWHSQQAFDFTTLQALYEQALAQKIPVRAYHPDWTVEMQQKPWPMPECRINEWCCLVNLGLVRALTGPVGKARLFGGYYSCGSNNFDIGAAWFRDMHHAGLPLAHYPVQKHVRHAAGHGVLFDIDQYFQVEQDAARQLHDQYPEFVALSHKSGLFSGMQI